MRRRLKKKLWKKRRNLVERALNKLRDGIASSFKTPYGDLLIDKD